MPARQPCPPGKYDAHHVAEMLQITSRHVHWLRTQGELKGTFDDAGNRWLFTYAAVEELVKHRNGQPGRLRKKRKTKGE